MPTRRSLSSVFIVIAAFAVASLPASAQEFGWPRWWFGVFGGVNVNVFDGTIRTPSTAVDVAAANGFTSGNGIGGALGALLEFNSGGLLGGNLMVGYDNRAFDADPIDDEELSISPAYISIEPNVRINLGGQRLHLTVGPAVAINVASGFSYTRVDSSGSPATVEGDLSDVRGLVITGQAGIGYDIPLTVAGASTQVVLTPFAQGRLGQGLIDPPTGDNDDLGITSWRLGLQLKFGSPEPLPPVVGAPPPRGDFDIGIRVPDVITETRTLRETFPVRNYVFFDAGSTDLPERYTRLSIAEADKFREEQLVRPEGTPGGADASEIRSRQQMRAYYNLLNILGDHMRRNVATTVRLVGAAGGDAASGRLMAENVKRYLVDTFGISERRVIAEALPMPPHRSGSGVAQGEDAKMIAAENHRVSIIGPEELVRPISITAVQEAPLDNDIVITIPASEEVAFWNVEIEDNRGQTWRFGPYRGTTTARIEAKPILGGESFGRYEARGLITLHDGSAMTSAAREFRLRRSESTAERTGTRYSILFEYDDSKTVDTYESFLAKTVAPSIPNGATVIVHGHTDLIGTPEYNLALAQKRADETQKILTRELTRAGKTVTFDTYGFGEDERRAPFDNILPEQRYYNRTVVIEVVPQ
jgi:hypothetical protein